MHNLKRKRISLSYIMTGVVTLIVLLVSTVTLVFFIHIYRGSIKENAIRNSEQSVVQVQNIIQIYVTDMRKIMDLIRQNVRKEEHLRNEFFQNLIRIQTDLIAVSIYDNSGSLISCYQESYRLKSRIQNNLSYQGISEQDGGINISNPHVQTMFENQYPWVVTMTQNMIDDTGRRVLVSLDFRFSKIADYVDTVGIGQHGYSYLVTDNSRMIYHPRQQLILAGLKSENTDVIRNRKEGSYLTENAIYTIREIEDTNWRIVGVSNIDEVITSRVNSAVKMVITLSLIVLITAFISGMVFSYVFSSPVQSLIKAMRDFERDAQKFTFKRIDGTSEIAGLSDSFDHMVHRIQYLMEKVREEDVILRKTELNALQAQINPHFLYNTLDSIAWMCEEKRTEEAVEMVNALARLFRISISRGHELIPLEKELQHAKSYLQIQKFRYKDQFSYRFEVDDSSRNYLCNKITLQPIIENAIVHGLDLVEQGEIVISVREKETEIQLTVEDNGVGMSEQQCKEVLYHEFSNRSGIGLKNVNDRIQIYFGEEYGCEIQSEQDIGTKVIIRIPKILEVNYEK